MFQFFKISPMFSIFKTYFDTPPCIKKFSWNDRRLVSTLNTFLPHSMQDVPGRRDTVKQKPSSIMLYNSTMGGVDDVDKILQPYATARKSTKWYKKIFFHLIDICVYNSFNVYKKNYWEKSNL